MAHRKDHDDETLWQLVTASIRPLKNKLQQLSSPKHHTPAEAKPAKNRPAAYHPAKTFSPTKKQKISTAPDSHWQRRLKSGDVNIEMTLDLHGCTQREAYHQLEKFIQYAARKKMRNLLVITGKGGKLGRGDGVLKQQLPSWLESGLIGDLIMTYHSAHQKHGGGGAVYVVLKKTTK